LHESRCDIMSDEDELVVRVPLKEYEVMVAAIEALADIRRGDKIIVDKATFEKLLKVLINGYSKFMTHMFIFG
jgi:hypothetical protein